MLNRGTSGVWCLLLLGSLCTAQVQRQIILSITVMLEGENQPTDKELTVTLMDEWGAIVGAQTTNRGMMQFLTKTGLRRIRIVGPEIEQVDEEFLVDSPSQGILTLRVRPRHTLRPQPKEASGPIPAIRLKIPGKAKKQYEKARQAMAEQRWAEARAGLEKAIAIYPDYDLAYCTLGTLELNLGDKAAARRQFEKAVELNDQYAEAFRKLASIHLSENRHAEAEAALRKSLVTEPADVWALSFLALAELKNGALAQAIADARKIHSLPHEGYASAHLIAARALEMSNRPQEALAEYQQYLAEDPEGSNAEQARSAVERIQSTSSAVK